MFSLRLVILNAFSEIQDIPLLVTQAGEMKMFDEQGTRYITAALGKILHLSI